MKRENKKRYNARGFTLVEILFTLLLFPLLALSIYGAMDMANLVFRTSNLYSQLDQNAMQTLRFISREIGQSSSLFAPSHLTIAPADANGNNTVTFQIPVDWDNDGDVITTNLNPVVEWGSYDIIGEDQNGRFGGWTRYLVVNQQLIRQPLDSTLTPVGGADQIVANNVQNFTVNRDPSNSRILQMSITLRGTDTIGQKGAAQRVLQSTFTSRTLLRNAVN